MNQEKIDLGIQNENYIDTVKLLLEEYNSENDVDILETIHNILRNSEIANRFTNENLLQLNEILIKNNFDKIERDFIENKTAIAEFPVVGENNNYNSIRSIVVTDGIDNNDICPIIENQQGLFQIIEYTQNVIQENLCDDKENTRDVTILNWGLTFSIKEHLLKGTKHEPEDTNYMIKGNSLHFAAVVACVSKTLNLPVDQNFIFTGAFNPEGEVKRILDLNEKVKLILAERPNTQKIFIPPKSKFNYTEQKLISSLDRFVQIENISSLIEKVYNKKIEEITRMNLEGRRRLGRARIRAEFIGKKELMFTKPWKTTVKKTVSCIVLHFERITNGDYKILPLKQIYHDFNSKGNGNDINFIILNLGVANHYTGHLIDKFYRQFPGIIGIREGRNTKNVIIFAEPKGGFNLLGFECNCDFLT